MTTRSFFNPAGDVASHVRAYKSGQVWSVSTSAWVTFNASNWTDYKITATSDGDGQFHASIPDDATVAYLCITGLSLAASPQVSYIDLTVATKTDVLAVAASVSNNQTSNAPPSVTFSATTVQTVYAEKDLPAIAQGSAVTIVWNINDTDGNPVNLTGKQVRFVLASASGLNDAAIALTGKVQYDTTTPGDSDKISLGGTGHNQVTVNLQAADTGTAGRCRVFVWNITDNQLLATGSVWIKATAKTKAA